MFATDEVTLLQEFLDEHVPCEVVDSEVEQGHDADIYNQFTCTYCGMSRIWASCNPCWTFYRDLWASSPGAVIRCSECRSMSPVSTVVNLGPVR